MGIHARVHNASIQDARSWLPQSRLLRPTGIRSHERIAGTPSDPLLRQKNRWTVHPTTGSHARVHTSVPPRGRAPPRGRTFLDSKGTHGNEHTAKWRDAHLLLRDHIHLLSMDNPDRGRTADNPDCHRKQRYHT